MNRLKKVGVGVVSAAALGFMLYADRDAGINLGHKQGLQEGITQEAAACVNDLTWQQLGRFVLTIPQVDAILKDPTQPTLPSELVSDLGRSNPENITVLGFAVEGKPSEQTILDRTNATNLSNLTTVESALQDVRTPQLNHGDTYGLSMVYGKGGGDPGSAVVIIDTPQC